MPCQDWAYSKPRKKIIPYADDLPYPEGERRERGEIRSTIRAMILVSGEKVGMICNLQNESFPVIRLCGLGECPHHR